MANRFLNNIRINDAYTFPASDGTSGQAIITDGSGNLSFGDIVPTGAVNSNYVFYEVKNSSGSTINKGTAVMAVGTDGNSGHILIAPMVADGSIEPKFFMGVLASTLDNGDIGQVIHFGELDQINTSTYQDGDVLWCDPATPGGFTVTEPLGPNLKIAAAIVINASTNGKIKVRVQGNEGLHELHDVRITTQADGELLIWDNTIGVWKNDGTLTVDYTNNRVGIGTSSPTQKLQVEGNADINGVLYMDFGSIVDNGRFRFGSDNDYSIGYDSASDTLRIADGNTLTSNVRLTIDASGNVGIDTSSPSYKMHVEGDFYANGTNGALTTATTASYLYLLNLTRSTTSLTTAGNAGIGLSSPTEKLDVAGNIKLTGAIKGPATFYIDPSPDDTAEPGGATTDTGTVVILGDLQVTGTTTTVNSTTVDIADLNITLASNAATAAEANGAGITIGGAGATITYDSTSNAFDFNRDIEITGRLIANDGTSNVAAEFISTDNRSSIIIQDDDTTAYIGVEDNILYLNNGTSNGIGYANIVAIDSVGRLGVQTSSPLGSIHIYDGSSGQTSPNGVANSLIIEDDTSAGMSILTPSTSNGNIFFGDESDNYVGGFRYYHPVDEMSINVNNAEAIRISSSRHVGIGTTNPIPPLHVYDPSTNVIACFESGDTLSYINIKDNASTNYGALLSVEGNDFGILTGEATGTSLTQRFTILGSNGNVGIGTSSPGYSLDITKPDPAIELLETASGTSTRFRLEVDSTGTTYTTTFGSGGGKQHIWKGGPAEVMRLDQNGNLGIGTDAPTGKLDVRPTNSCNYVFTGTSTSGYTTTFNMDDNALAIGHNSGSRDLYLKTNSLERLTIAGTNGNIGIGTTSPAYKLDVSGDIAALAMYDNDNTAYYIDPAGSSNLNGATLAGNLHLARTSIITFYGNAHSNHSISSRGIDWAATDDIRINSYGSVFINLDSNDNNASSADFRIGRHGGEATINDILLTLNGENGNLTVSGSVNAAGGNSGEWNTAYTYSQVGHLPLSGGTMSGDINAGGNKITNLNSIVLNNNETTGLTQDGQIVFDLNDSSAPASLGTYAGTYPDGLYLYGNSTVYTMYHTGHFSGTNIANWETAYGWGNHASAGYQSASSSFFKPFAELGSAVNLNDFRTSGYASQNSNSQAAAGSNYPTAFAGMFEVVNDDTGNGLHTTQRYSQYNTNNFYARNYYSGTWTSWTRFLTTDDEGSGNGLDADTVDGLQASQFLRSDTSDTMSGNLDVNGTIQANGVVNVVGTDSGNPSAGSDQIRVSGYGILGNRGTFYVTNPGIVQIGVGTIHANDPAATFDASAISLLKPTTVSTSVSAPIFYDSDNTGYYINPADTSNFYNTVSFSYSGNGNVGGTGSAAWFPQGLYSASGKQVWIYGNINRGGANTTNGGGYYGTIFYETGDTSYYLDPASTSNLSKLHIGSAASLGDGTDPDISTTLLYSTSKVVTPKLVFLNDANGDDNYITCNDGNTAYAVNGQSMAAWYQFIGDKSAASGNNSGGIVASGILSAHGSFSQSLTLGGNTVLTTAGGTVTGAITASGGINMNNTNITGVNHIVINDAGAGEGIEWSGGNGWKIYESPNDLTNSSGNLQFVTGSIRRATIDNDSNIFALGSMRAPTFYDSNNTAYNLNPASTSRLNQVDANYLDIAASSSYAFRFWNGDNNYSIRMSTSTDGTYGGRMAGETTSDYNMYFTMAGGTNRGFVFNNGLNNAIAGIDASGNGRFAGNLTASGVEIQDSAIPTLTINDTGNAGGGGASGRILFKNTAGNSIGLGYTSNVTSTSDLIISTDASSTYGGYLGLNAGAISDPSDIILDPKNDLLITKHTLVLGDLESRRQIRALGWWNTTGGNTGDLAFEIGVSSGEAYALSYNRNTATYGDMNFAAVNFNFDERGGTTTIENNEIWHAGNDGSGSGLDADTVDGIEAFSLLRNDAEVAGWVPAYSNADPDTVRWNVTEQAMELQSSTDVSIGAAFRAVRARAGDKVRFTINVKGSTASSQGLYLRIYYYAGNLPNGKTHVSNSASYAFVQEDTGGDTGWVSNAAVPNTWTTYERTFTMPADGYVSLVTLNWTAHGSNSIYYKTPDIQFEKVLDSTLWDGNQFSSYLNQALLTTSSPTFNTVDVQRLDVGNEIQMVESSDRADLLQITSVTSSWAGIQVRNSSNEGRWSFMTDGTTGGFYDDENSDWAIQMLENSEVRLYFNASEKLNTKSSGVHITGELTASSDIIAYSSDERLKENIELIKNPLYKLKQLKGVTYSWKQGVEEIGFIPNQKEEIGVLAQDVQKVIPHAVKPAPFDTDNEGNSRSGENYLTVQYEKIVPLLIEAIKEQQQQIDELKALINK